MAGSGPRRRITSALPQPSSALALRAEVGVALRDLHALDRRPAPPTRQADPPVHLQLVLVLARLAEQVDVGLVVEGGAARLDRLLQRLLDGAVEATDLLRRERVRHPVVAEPRA